MRFSAAIRQLFVGAYLPLIVRKTAKMIENKKDISVQLDAKTTKIIVLHVRSTI